MPPGNYYHFGLANALTKSVLKYYMPEDFPSEIKFDINVDGPPLTKSSGSQFWPILTAVEAPFHTEPCIVGIYHGNEKPLDSNDLLQYFVEDALKVCGSGIDIQGHEISCGIGVFICDAPAKAYITDTKGHNAYFGCSKCMQEGEFKVNRLTYPETGATLRTDLKIRMVSQFPLDYLHLICLGIMKRLLQFRVKGKKNVHMTNSQLKLATAHLMSLVTSIPKEFARKPRPLKQVNRYKAPKPR
ncbi:uncharacterized protein [Neodiprion pinetum]|uniref:uncharacterized protein n=1 Tax=Neodiprion pinetum TaxID=441929 RepID=UPI001EDE5BC6|nr:uncharacterized protein LOC124220365 [Neodiprion pinetum]